MLVIFSKILGSTLILAGGASLFGIVVTGDPKWERLVWRAYGTFFAVGIVSVLGIIWCLK